MRNRTILFTTLLAVTIFFSCGNISDKKIRIAYANWAEGIAVTYLAKEILSEQGYRTELLNADIAPIFTSLARGKTDVFMDSWMPVTHADYFQKYDGKLEILGQIYDSAVSGLWYLNMSQSTRLRNWVPIPSGFPGRSWGLTPVPAS